MMKRTYATGWSALALIVAMASGLATPVVAQELGLPKIQAAGSPRDAMQRLDVRPPRQLISYPFRGGSGLDGVQTVIGQVRTYLPKKGETFLDIARDFDLGYNEMLAANPGRDPWVLGEGTPVIVPSEWILPAGRLKGVVMNIPEMRLYYFRPDGPQHGTVLTFPVGLGRRDWKTPIGAFTIRGKTSNPTWIIPESIRKERIEEDGLYEREIPGGSPDNPLGKHRFELTLPSYAIHGTNKNWGVGMEVSHGCVRLYPEDIEALFPKLPVGTPGAFVYQPVKIGVSGGRILIEVHEDIYSVAPWPWKLAEELLRKQGLTDYVDREALEAALDAESGIPTDIGTVPEFGDFTELN